MINRPTTEAEFKSTETKAMNNHFKARAERKAHYANEENLEAARNNIFGITVETKK